jgi:hypothetical protein
VLEQHYEAKCQDEEQAEPENAPQKPHIKRVAARDVGSTAVTLDVSCNLRGARIYESLAPGG